MPFVKGNIPWIKGRKHSKETIKKVKNARKKQIFSEDSFKKRSISLMGHKVSKETRIKIRDAQIGKIIPIEQRIKIRESVIKNPSKKFKDTSIEIKIENELQLRNISYKKQVPLCKIARVDFFLPNYNIVIQCDGCHWHNCPIHLNPVPLKGKNERDKYQDSVLISNGYKVYRFWEHEINESVEKCINSLGL
jgi:very-short-patch-repair endonuclease